MCVAKTMGQQLCRNIAELALHIPLALVQKDARYVLYDCDVVGKSTIVAQYIHKYVEQDTVSYDKRITSENVIIVVLTDFQRKPDLNFYVVKLLIISL